MYIKTNSKSKIFKHIVFPGKTAAIEIPSYMQKLIGIPADTKGFVGAYSSK